MEEVWKKVVDYEEYYKVSNLGNVEKLPTFVYCPKGGYIQNGKRMSPFNNGRGYMAVSFTVKGRKKNHYVHRLVADAFVPNPKNKRTVNHKDGNKSNNNVTNLEWATYSENLTHAVSVLGVRINEKSPLCKIGEKDVVKIFEMFATGNESHYSIANKFGVDRNHVFCILSRTKRLHVDIPENLIFKTRLVAVAKNGLAYAKNKEWFDEFDVKLKTVCYELWHALHNNKKGYMKITKDKNLI